MTDRVLLPHQLLKENVFSREHRKKVKTEVKASGEIIFPPLRHHQRQINQQQRKMWGDEKVNKKVWGAMECV